MFLSISKRLKGIKPFKISSTKEEFSLTKSLYTRNQVSYSFLFIPLTKSLTESMTLTDLGLISTTQANPMVMEAVTEPMGNRNKEKLITCQFTVDGN